MATVAEVDESEPGIDDPLAGRTFLRRVQLHNYKSIAFCDVALEPLTVFVGRNAAGKSNFLDALGFLSDVMKFRVGEAVSGRGGWRAVHCRTARTPLIEMAVEVQLPSDRRSQWHGQYAFALELGAKHQIRIARESLTLADRPQGRVCGFNRTPEQVEWIGQQQFAPTPELLRPNQVDRLTLSVLGTPPFLDVAENLRTSCVYDFFPDGMRALRPIGESPTLKRYGENLARAIKGLREIEPASVARLKQHLAAIVPGVAGFRVKRYGDFETVRFTLKLDGIDRPMRINASSASDGTLRALACLIASRQIVVPTGPGFVAIEEPETALHPAAMRALVGALDESTLRTQIFLTTHSPDLLDTAQVTAERVRVVEMVNGHTVVGRVDADGVQLVRENLCSLGDLERDQRMTLDPDDVERQTTLARQGGAAP